MELIVALNTERGITVLMVTHEPDMAAYARRIVHFVDGRIDRDGVHPEVHPGPGWGPLAAEAG
jgi:putative ABC transport system ATP-binding protein